MAHSHSHQVVSTQNTEQHKRSVLILVTNILLIPSVGCGIFVTQNLRQGVKTDRQTDSLLECAHYAYLVH